MCGRKDRQADAIHFGIGHRGVVRDYEFPSKSHNNAGFRLLDSGTSYYSVVRHSWIVGLMSVHEGIAGDTDTERIALENGAKREKAHKDDSRILHLSHTASSSSVLL